MGDQQKGLTCNLDEDLDQFIETEVESRKETNLKPEPSVEELLEELSTHPAFLKEIDYTKPLHPATEALIALQYDIDDDTERAEKYKIDGNDNFKRKRYHWAIDNYNEGILAKSTDCLLNAQLYTNRAACQYHLGNYRTCLNDVIVARKFVPNHLKAIVRGAQCCFQLKKFVDCKTWCERGLLIEPHNKDLVDLLSSTVIAEKEKERDNRKKAIVERKLLDKNEKIKDAIKNRGIRIKFASGDDENNFDLSCPHPEGQPVHLSDDGSLLWPVLFLYPEHLQTDFVNAMNENTRFVEQLDVMFGKKAPRAQWDVAGHYTRDKLHVFIKDEERDKLLRIDLNSTLTQAMQHERYTLVSGAPTFLILSKASDFYNTYLDAYK